jgi:membrane protein YdbS with pleckstrin-like domain
VIDSSHFSGQQAGEEIELYLRRHPLSLVWDLRVVFLLLAGYMAGLAIFADALAASPVAGILLLATLTMAVLLGLATLWTYAVWYYDIYVVTDRRLLDFARKPLIYERRDEAQLTKLQDVRVEFPNPLALLLDFGNVQVQTAGSRGTIKCSLVSHPRQVQARILQLAAAAQQRTPVGVEAPEASQMRAYLGMPTSEDPSVLPTMVGAPAFGRSTLRPLGWRGYLHTLLRPNLEVAPGDRVWRKHWWVLMRATAVSGALFNAGIILGVVMVWKVGFVPWLAIPLAMFVVGGIWNLWNVLDWQNDLYILTADRIIDLDKAPFISEDRREARLQQIQDVHYVMPSFINRLLDFGDVEVETAGRVGGFTFHSVPHPRQVQAEIFARVDQARNAAGALESERQEGNLLSVLYRYHQAGQAPDAPAGG